MSIEVHSSSPEQPGTLICHADYAPDGVRTAVTVTRADEWIQVNQEFVNRLIDEGDVRQDAQSLMLTVGTHEIVVYRHVRPFDQHSDLYQRVTRLPGEPMRLTGPGRAAQKHGPLCTIDTATGQCRSPHCRVCGGVADAQGFCPACPAESGPHADGFRLAVLKSAAAVESPDRPHAAQEAAAEQKRQLPIAAEVRQPLTVEDYMRINPMCEHGIIKGLIVCPKCDPELQAPAEAHAAGRAKGYKNPLQPQVGELAARVDELQATLTEVLKQFGEKGHPGYEAIRTGWVRAEQLAKWQRVADGRPSFDELIEQLVGVELTDEQRAMVQMAWGYHERSGMWPLMLQSRQPGKATVREALRQLVEISGRYA